jgi:hypothetical protein
VRALDHLPVVWCFVLLLRPLGLVISFILRLVILFISLFVTLCVKIDLDTHKGMHSVLALKLGVTEVVSKSC